MRGKILQAGVLVWIALFSMPAHAQSSYAFDASHSSMEINVYKEGFFKAFGHEHLIAPKDFSGAVQFDANDFEKSSVTLRVPTKTLTVVDPGESERDREQVQATMLGESVLDSSRYPEIVFRSTRVAHAVRQGDGWSISLDGSLQLHGTQKPVTFPLTVRVSGDELIGQGELFLLQTDYGITPVKVGGGTVKVKDRIRVHFEIHAKQKSARRETSPDAKPSRKASDNDLE